MELQVWATRPASACGGGSLGKPFQLLGSPNLAVQTAFVQHNEASVLASSTLSCACNILGVSHGILVPMTLNSRTHNGS